jgi:hypothetical protein
MNTRASGLHGTAILTTIGVSVLLISGCAGPAGDSDGTASDSPSTTASATADPTAEPAPSTPVVAEPNLDEPSTWLIDYTSVGPLALADRLSDETASMAAFSTTIQEACPWETAFEKTDFPSIWIPDPSASGIVDQIVLQAWGSAPTVAANSPQTSAGVGIGATLDELTTAYPDIEENDGLYAPFYSLPDGSGHWINFGLSADGIVDTIVVRDSPKIDSEYCG